MLRPFILFFFVFVIVEMALLITLGRWLGVVPTIVLVLGAGFVGAWLARWQGLRTAMRARSRLALGAMPTTEMTDALLIGLAAVLLIIPGVLTDVLGLALLFPPTRTLVRSAIAAQWARRSPLARGPLDDRRPAPAGPAPPRDQIIDARVIETRIVDE